MKKLSAFFYILLAVLSVAVLLTLSLWLWLKEIWLLILMCALFAVYLAHLCIGLTRGKRQTATENSVRNSLKTLCANGNVTTVYLVYYGNERRISSPSPVKRDYFLECYPDVEDELLQKHLWYGLDEENEGKLDLLCIYSNRVSAAVLSEIKGMKLYLPKPFFEKAVNSNNTVIKNLLKENTPVCYGKE